MEIAMNNLIQYRHVQVVQLLYVNKSLHYNHTQTFRLLLR